MGLTRYEAEVTVFDESSLYKLEQHSVYLAAEVEAVLTEIYDIADGYKNSTGEHLFGYAMIVERLAQLKGGQP